VDFEKTSMDLEEVIATAKTIGDDYTGHWHELGVTWYDHRYDWARGPENWMWCERAVVGNRYIEEGDRVLDLCCGDGIFSGLVFSKKASLVHGIDRDPRALTLAREHYAKDNVEFFERDILKDDFPATEYDAVLFLASIEHFTLEEIHRLLEKIAKVLSPGGIFVGSTLLLNIGSNPEHAVEFETIEDLEILLSPHFENVETWTTTWDENRTDVYFLCHKD